MLGKVVIQNFSVSYLVLAQNKVVFYVSKKWPIKLMLTFPLGAGGTFW